MTQPDEPRLPRATSVTAHEAVMQDGTVRDQQKQIYSALYRWGPMTATECIQVVNTAGDRKISENTHTRFAELRRRGVIHEVGKKVCKHTKKRCISWDVTGEPPLPAEKGEPRPSTPTVSEPTAGQFAAASNELRSLHALAAMHGRGFSEELLRVCEWIHGKGQA